MTGTLPHVLRSDAQDNRDRVLQAARELFAEAGLGVTMRQIARYAGVGPATIYRRFPAKQDLVLEAFMDEFRACTTIVREAAADPDAWRGICGIIERVTRAAIPSPRQEPRVIAPSARRPRRMPVRRTRPIAGRKRSVMTRLGERRGTRTFPQARETCAMSGTSCRTYEWRNSTPGNSAIIR